MKKLRRNPGVSPSDTAREFLRKYGSQALGWAKTASTIHRSLRDRIFWRKVYGCILRSLQRGDPLPNPARRGARPFGKKFVIHSPVGPVYRVDGAAVRNHTVDGAAGWHRLVYPKLVPGEEVWIEKLVGGAKEERYILAHEMVEISLMRILGWKYQRAHDTANRSERKLRAGCDPLKVFAAVLRRHMPARYQLDVAHVAESFAKAYRSYQ